MKFLKTLSLLACAFLLAACSDEPTPKSSGLDCGDGDVLSLSSTELCVYRGELLVETGFTCPDEVEHASSYGTLVVCSSDRELPSDFFDAADERYPDDVPSGECRGVVCEVGETCDGGSCESRPTPDPTCVDGAQNGDETGIDCGGSCDACPTCTDSVQNGDETGLDCGGSCEPCAACTDGVQNGEEEGVDCGGDCAACATCADGVQNGDEQGVDCGGSCATACPTCTDGVRNGTETGIDCGGSCPACMNCVPDAKRIFQTSNAYDADLVSQTGEADGLAAGDAICQLHADAANLGGQWVAWLSTSTTPADDHVADAGPWYAVDRCTLLATNKTALYVNGPNEDLGSSDENGERVVRNTWTGTQRTGQTSPFNCSDWTSSSPFSEGLIGLGSDSFLAGGWTDSSTNPCNLQASLFCFEQ